jgi:hypothetical protein
MSKADQRRLFKIFLNRLNERDIESKEDLETFGDKYFKEVCRFDSVIATDWLGIQRQRHSQSVFVGACHRASGEHQAPETAHRHCAGVQEERAEDVCGAENDCTDGEGVRIGGFAMVYGRVQRKGLLRDAQPHRSRPMNSVILEANFRGQSIANCSPSQTLRADAVCSRLPCESTVQSIPRGLLFFPTMALFPTPPVADQSHANARPLWLSTIDEPCQSANCHPQGDSRSFSLGLPRAVASIVIIRGQGGLLCLRGGPTGFQESPLCSAERVLTFHAANRMRRRAFFYFLRSRNPPRPSILVGAVPAA